MESITVEPYGGMADLAFWPVTLLCVALAWRFRANRIAISFAVIAIMILAMGFIFVVVFGMTSLSVRHDYAAGGFIIGAMLFALAVAIVSEITNAGWKTNQVLGLFGIGLGFAGLAMLVYGIAIPVADLVLPLRTVEGTVTFLNTQGRRPVTNIVRIGNTQVEASTRLYVTLRVGQHVRAEVSRGSDFIRRLERSAAPDISDFHQ